MALLPSSSISLHSALRCLSPHVAPTPRSTALVAGLTDSVFLFGGLLGVACFGVLRRAFVCLLVVLVFSGGFLGVFVGCLVSCFCVFQGL